MSRPPRVRLALEALETRDNPSVLTETFDSASPPALPTGWAEWSSDGSTVFATAAGQGVGGSVGVVSSGTSRTSGLAWLALPVSGDTGAGAAVDLNSLIPTFVFTRGANLGTATPSYLAATVTRGAALTLTEVVNGTTTVLASVQSPSSSYFSNGWVQVTLVPSGSSVSVQVVRQDTGQYLNAQGAWQSAATSVITATTHLADVSGDIGIGRGPRYSGATQLDNFETILPPPPPGVSQSFDTTPVGTLPTGWSGWSAGAPAGFAVSAAQALSPPDGFASTGTSNSAARAWYGTALPADVTATAAVYLGSLIPSQLFVRGANLNTSSPTYYGVTITRGLQVSLVRVVNGASTTLGTLGSTSYFSSQWVRVQLTAVGTQLLVSVYRPDTQKWLTPAGAWSATPAYALNVQDAAITAGGDAGVGRLASYAGTVTFDDFAAGAAATFAPAVTLTSSGGSGPVSGTVKFQATATGTVTQIAFELGGQVEATSATDPATWALDTTALANGTYTLTALAGSATGTVGSATDTITVDNPTSPPPFTIPQHYPNIRVAELAYTGTPIGSIEQQLLQNSVDLVVSAPQLMPTINSVAPNTPQLIYSNVSNLYQGLLLNWMSYANANGTNPEAAFYHVTQPTPYSGSSASSIPVDWFWGVYQSTGTSSLTDFTSASHTNSGTAFALGSAGQWTAAGYPDPYAELDVTVNQAAAPGWGGVWQYATAVDANGGPTAWQTLPIKQDVTVGMTQSGTITFDPPANWVASAVQPGGESLYYVRFLVTSGAASQAPVLSTLLGADYTGSRGGNSGVIPVFDSAADTNHDGYLDDAEWANRAPGDNARFAYQSRLFYPYYGAMRFVTDPSSPQFQAWAATFSQQLLAQNPLADGIFLDNESGQLPFAGIPVVEPTAGYSANSGTLVAAVAKAIGPSKLVMVNASGSGSSLGPVAAAAGAVFEESYLRPLASTWSQLGDASALVSQLLATPGKPYVVLDSLPSGGSPTDPRTEIATLAEYYLLADPTQTMLMFYGGYSPSTPWAQHWSAAATANIGQPTGAMQILATGADPENTALTYKVFGRSYSDGLVLYKPLSYTLGVGTGTLDDATATSVALGGNYRVVNSDGTLGPVVNSVTLRNGEGAVLVKA